MTTHAQRRAESRLLELTSLPTAAGCEQQVIDWVERWAAGRRWLSLHRDKFGHIELRRRGARSTRPVYFEAHMDHPAFVVTKVTGRQGLAAEFRGFVHAPFFDQSRVWLHHGGSKPQRGVVQGAPTGERKNVAVRFAKPMTASPGDMLTWDVGRTRISDGRLLTCAADNLAGVAAALTAFDQVHRTATKSPLDVRVLLTRCEEVGLVGATGVCAAGLLPPRARVIVLENSKSFAESPIGGGPIVRVGDSVSTFDPELTYRIALIAQQTAKRDASFKWQRKLMPGGVCEASAFQAYGYTSACVCLPLGNYHNMNERTGRIGPETISVADFHALTKLLAAAARSLFNVKSAPGIKARLEERFEMWRQLLDA